MTGTSMAINSVPDPSGMKTWPELDHVENTQELNRVERELTVWQAVMSNPKIIGLTIFSNLGFFSYGFDAIAFSICLSMTPFVETFGVLSGGTFIIPAYWQSIWNAVTQLMIMLGACCTGSIADRFGRWVTMFIAGACSLVGVGLTYSAHEPGVYLAGKMVNGLGLGLLTTVSTTYISEIAPLRLRGICLSALIFSTNLGCLIASSIAYSRVHIMDNSSYKVLFATGWIWPSITIAVCPFIPESPHYHVRNGKMNEARDSLKCLRPADTPVDALLHDIITTHRNERQMQTLSKSRAFLECFQGTNLRRTLIILILNATGQLIGAAFVNNAPYFLIQAGMSSTKTSMVIEIGFSLGIVTAAISWLFMDSLGRRWLLYVGFIAAIVLYIGMGIAGCFPDNNIAQWAVGILILLVICTNGPVSGAASSISGEISQIELRAMSQTIGFAFNYFFGTVWQVVVPYMFNSDEGNLGGKMGWIFATTSIIGVILVYFKVPETKNRSYAELDHMFKIGLPTGDFKDYIVEDI